MKLLISLSKDTQNNVVEFPIDANGNVFIPMNSLIGKTAFLNIGGKANFIGQYAEVAHELKNTGAGKIFDIFATEVGKGLKNVTTTTQIPIVEQMFKMAIDAPQTFN